MRYRTLLLAAASAVLLIAACERSVPPSPETAGKDWPVHGGMGANTRYSGLDQINPGNVKTLGAAWNFDLGQQRSKGPPVVLDGVMYVAAAGGNVTALDAKTGTAKWIYTPTGPGLDVRNRGLAVGGGKVYFGLTDGSVSAVDAATGMHAWTTYIGDGPARFGMFVSAAPAYADGKVLAGLASGDAGIKGRFVALDAATGKLVWQFNTIPHPGEAGHETWPKDDPAWENGGAGVWMVASVDMKLGMVYFGTSNASPQYGGEVRPGDNLFTATTLALDLKTGKEKWHFQALHHDIWEGDLGAPMVLYDQEFGGKTRSAIGVLRTDGYLFVLDRATGAPIIPVEQRPVKQNARLHTAATQPYPVGVDKVGPECVEKDLIPAGFEAACYWDPIDFTQPNMIFPTSARYAPMSYSPRTKLIYISGMSGGHWIRRGEDPYFFSLPGIPGMKSYGILAALDSRTGKIAWQKKTPYPMAFGSGTTATAGDLLFHGEPDGQVQAFDAKTGDVVWSFQTGGDATAPVSVYEVAGKQYVAISATNRIWSFALGGTVAALPAPPAPPTESDFAGRIFATDQVAMSANIKSIGVIKDAEFTDEYVFEPMRIRVEAGASVTWKNDGKEPHTASSQDGSWNTGAVAPGKTATVKFDKPGTYTYVCKEHPWTYGQIIVE
ncbi:MAG: PQQ-binding-like beta-propeller repeat protein [Rhodospirillaceae bacterium]|nr:PQQ-binding-like beta-propeller repeat protein [Rhodospirillaceae bacterium]